MTLVYRQIKGSKLTIEEGDGNIEDLDGRIVVLESLGEPIPLSGTTAGNEVTGNVGFADGVKLISETDPYNFLNLNATGEVKLYGNALDLFSSGSSHTGNSRLYLDGSQAFLSQAGRAITLDSAGILFQASSNTEINFANIANYSSDLTASMTGPRMIPDIGKVSAMITAGAVSTTLTSAYIYVGNGSNVATGVAMSGVIAITNAGLTSFSAGTTGSGAVALAASPSFTGTISAAAISASSTVSAQSVGISGTGGLGVLVLGRQSSSPSASAAAGTRLFSDASGYLAWRLGGTTGDNKIRLFDGVLTADRTYTLPDASITLIGDGSTVNELTFTNIYTSGYSSSSYLQIADNGVSFVNIAQTFSTRLTAADTASSDKVITLPDVSGDAMVLPGSPTDAYVLTYDSALPGTLKYKWAASAGGGGDMVLASVQTVTGAKTFNSTKLILAGSTSGTTILNAAAVAGSGTVTLPTTGTLATLAGSEALTNKTYNGNTWTAGSATLTLAGNLITTGAFNTTFAQAVSGTITMPAYAGNMVLSNGALTANRIPYHTASGLANSLYTDGTSLGIGAAPTNSFDVNISQNSGTIATIRNSNAGSGAYAYLQILNNSSNYVGAAMFSSTWSTSGINRADGGQFACTGLGGFSIGATNASGVYRLFTGGSADANVRMLVSSTGLTSIGSHSPVAQLDVMPLASTIGLRIGFVSGTANALEIRSAAPAVLTNFDYLGRLFITDTTASGAGTGALVVTGGLYAGNLYIPGVCNFTNTSVVTFSGTVACNIGLSIGDGFNIATGTTTGSIFGATSSQKHALWGKTPIVQPTTAIAAATFVANTSAIANDTATWDGYTIGQVIKAARNWGLLA